MPLPNYVAQTDIFFTWLDAFNNTLSHIDNTSAYLLVSQNATPRISTGNVSLNGTATFETVNASGTISANLFTGNGVSLTTLNASALAVGTVPLAQLTSANTTANGVVSTTTQTFAGNKTFDNDVTIAGTLTLVGEGVTLNTNNIIVQDSLIQLAANNTTSDALDIGLFGNYNGDGGGHEHTGLFRDASDGVWKLFVGLQDTPTNTTINTTGTGYSIGTLQTYLTSGGVVANSSAFAVTANSSYSGTLTVNTVTAATFTGNLTGTASNATNLNSQPGSYYTNASNLATGTVPVARLDANVILTTSSTGINASALSTGIVPVDRLSSANTTSNGVVDTTTQTFAGNKAFAGVLLANGGSKIVVQNGVDGTSTRGIFLWTETDSNWGLYLSQAGASKSLANGTATSSLDSRSGWHVRSRSGSLNSEGFIWENQGEVVLMSLTGDTGNLYLKGNVYIGGSTTQVGLHTGSTTGINASALSTGTVPLARLTSANTTANGIVDTLTQTFAGDKTFQNTVTVNAVVLQSSVTANGETGSSGQVLTSNGTGIYWANAGAVANSSGGTGAVQFYNGTTLGSSANLLFTDDSTLKIISTSTVNVIANGSTILVQSSATANVSLTATQLSIANASGTLTLTPTTVTGNITIQNTASFSNTVSMTGAVNALSTLGVTGVFTASANSTLTGAVTMSNTVSITGAANALNTLGVTGIFTALANSTLTGAVTMSNTVSITGAANALGTLGVTGTLTALGQLVVTTNATFDTNTLFVDATNDRVGIGNTTPTHKLRIEGTGSFSGNLAVNSTNTSAYTLFVDGSFAATTKSFVIPHPTKPTMKLRYGSLEGPENGVYVRGESTTSVITLPEYWSALVNAESLTVSLTPIGTDQRLYVVSANTSEIVVGSSNWLSWTPHFYYVVYGERQDVPKLDVEI